MNATVIAIVYVLVIMGFFILLIFLPEKRRKKKFNQMMGSLRVNDEILTRGGIIGKVTNIEDKFIVIQSGPDMARIKLLKGAVEKILSKEIEEKK